MAKTEVYCGVEATSAITIRLYAQVVMMMNWSV